MEVRLAAGGGEAAEGAEDPVDTLIELSASFFRLEWEKSDLTLHDAYPAQQLSELVKSADPEILIIFEPVFPLVAYQDIDPSLQGVGGANERNGVVADDMLGLAPPADRGAEKVFEEEAL